jgi:hypothetical protein
VAAAAPGLRGGHDVGADLPDVVDPVRGPVVPVSFRTDGRWIWNEAATYYLDLHRLAPDPGLVAYARDRGYATGEVDGATLHRAGAALTEFMIKAGRGH